MALCGLKDLGLIPECFSSVQLGIKIENDKVSDVTVQKNEPKRINIPRIWFIVLVEEIEFFYEID